MKYIAPIIALLFCCLTINAQEPTVEYGSTADLKGVSKIFVDTGLEMEVRENILKEISKSKKKIPDLEIVSRPEDAEVILVFGAKANSYLSGVNSSTSSSGITTSYPIYRNVIRGNGTVIKLVGENRVRLIMSFEDSRTSRFERRPSTNFARKFIHAYMDANGIKR
jgi:hypothetical protein